ncbi:MAG: glycerate kinase [Halanaerobiales bacterium]
MNILIAPDSFKESLTAMEVASSLKRGLAKVNSSFNIKLLPMADGGEGTVKSLVNATNGKIFTKMVTGPLGNEVEAFFGMLGDKKTAVIEMAAASGLPLVPEDKRDPTKTTTYGTGELIKEALNKGSSKIIIGIGGSATTDCGIGMAQALGAKFLDKSGNEVGFGGENLIKIQHIDLSELDKRLNNIEIQVACDVDNPLYGKDGAAYVYGPQKGASKKDVKKLDKGLRHIARVIENDLNKKIANVPGAGAAGGLGAGLLAFLNAVLKPGIDIVIEASKIKEKMNDIDLVITGEGKLDAQTVAGKTPVGVARVARDKNIPVIAIAGTLGENAKNVYDHGIDTFFSIINSPLKLDEALDKSSELLEDFGENLGRLINIFYKF